MKNLAVSIFTLSIAVQAMAAEPGGFWDTGIVTEKFNIGAWADAMYLDQSRDEYESFFNLSQIYFQANWNFARQWRLFGETAYERLPGGNGQTQEEWELERLFLEYKRSPALMFRLGKFDTQAGIVKPIHWTVILDSLRSPIMEKNGYIPAKSIGLEILGKWALSKGFLSYSFSLSHSKSEVADDEPINRAKGAGLDVYYSEIGRFRVGSSLYFYRDPKDKDRGVTGFLPYLEWHILPQKLMFRTEYLELTREQTSNLDTWYAKVKYQFHPQAYLNLRYDRGLDEALASRSEREAKSITLAYWPVTKWRIKLEHTWNDFEDGTAFREWAIWTGIILL